MNTFLEQQINLLIDKNIITPINQDIGFFEYQKDGNTIFYINFQGISELDKVTSKILWNKWASNIIISLDLQNNKIYLWDTRNFEYENKKSLLLEEVENLDELLTIANNKRYEEVLNNISNSIENEWLFAWKLNQILENRKKENTVNKELLKDLKEVFKLLKDNNQYIENIDKTLVKVILQMLFVCFLKDNNIDVIPEKILNIKDIFNFLKEIKIKFNWELFDETQLEIWKNEKFNNDDNFDVLKAVFFDRTWKFENKQMSFLFKSESWKLIFEKYNFKYIPTILISNIYEWLLEFIYKQNKKKLWIFYTRPNVVKSILNRYLKKDLEKYDFEKTFPKIYDPTCWSWVFLVSAFELIINHIESKNKKLDFNQRKKILEETIYWSDLEDNSIYITEFSLYLELLKWIWDDYKNKENKFPNLLKSKNLIKWDSLLWWSFYNEKLTLKNWLEKIFFKYKFDYIFWNPPWSKDIFWDDYKKEIEKELKIKSVEASESFIIKSKEYVKKWWKICLLTNSKNYYRDKWDKFRKIILDNFVLEELINFNDINEYLFENTLEPATLITLLNEKKKENYDIKFLKVEESNFSKYYIFTLDWKHITTSKDELLENIDKWWIFYKWDKYDLNLINYLIEDKNILDNIISNNSSLWWFQISWEKQKQNLKKYMFLKKEKFNSLFIYIDQISKYLVEKKYYLDFNSLEKSWIHRNRSWNKYIFEWNKIFFNSKNKSFAFIWENSYFLDKTYVLKFDNKKENYYFYILWLLNSSLINNYFLENYSFRRWLKWWKHTWVLVEDIKNIPIPNLEEDNLLFEKISELAKELYKIHQEENNQEQIKIKQQELDKYVMIAYNIFSDIDKQIIADFWKNDLDENINDDDLIEYWELFAETFWNSAAGAIMKRQKIIWDNIDFKYWKDSFLWLSWICFNFNNSKITEKFENLTKELFSSSLESDDVFNWIENSRVYLSEKRYLFIIKPNKKKYWTLSNAYKDSLYENELIFKNIKIK